MAISWLQRSNTSFAIKGEKKEAGFDDFAVSSERTVSKEAGGLNDPSGAVVNLE